MLAPSRLSSSSSSARRERFSRPVVADHRRCARSQSPTEPKGGFRTNFPRESNGPSLCSFPLSLLSVSLGRKFTHYLRSPSVGARGHSGTVARLRSLALPPPPTHAFSVPFRYTCLLSPALFLLRCHHYRPFAPPFSRSLSSSSSPSISFPLASLSATRLFVLLREFTLSLLLCSPPSSLPRFVLLSSTDFRAASSLLSSLVASRASLLVRLEIPRFSVSVPLSATFHLPLLSHSLILSFSHFLILSFSRDFSPFPIYPSPFPSLSLARARSPLSLPSLPRTELLPSLSNRRVRSRSPRCFILVSPRLSPSSGEEQVRIAIHEAPSETFHLKFHRNFKARVDVVLSRARLSSQFTYRFTM